MTDLHDGFALARGRHDTSTLGQSESLNRLDWLESASQNEQQSVK